MKGSLFVIALLLAALIVGCAPTVSGESQAVIADTSVIGLEPTPAPPADTLELTAVPMPTSTLAPAPTATPEPPASPTQSMPTYTPEVNSTSIPIPSPSPAASATPTSAPEVASAPTSPSAPTPAPQNGANQEELVSRGLEVYREQYCGICHQLDAADTAGRFGPAHNDIGAIADQRIQAPGYAGSATSAEEYIRESLLDPTAYIVPGYELTSHHMPAYAHLEEGDIDALVQMLLHQK